MDQFTPIESLDSPPTDSPRTSSRSPRTRSPRNSDEMSVSSRNSYKDVASRLHNTTAATRNAQWVDKEGPKEEGPVFSTAVRRASVNMGDISPRQMEKYEYTNNPYKDSVESRLFATTAAATHGKYEKKTTDDSDVGKNKHTRRFSTTAIPTDFYEMTPKALPSNRSQSDSYASVQPRLHMLTASAQHGKWTPDKSKTDNDSVASGSPRFNSSTIIKHCAMGTPPPPVPKSTVYEEVGPRLHESTAARDRAKYTPPPPPADGNLPGFKTTIRRGSIPSRDEFAPPPPIPENRSNPYKQVVSRLHEPTTASVEGIWKKPEVRMNDFIYYMRISY
jgi:hypothetical protein